jgi:hypothetical protein
VSGLYLYALVSPPSHGAELGAERGLAEEPLELLDLGGVLAVTGELAGAPPLEAATLAAHDATVRRLGAHFPATLPARFGQWAAAGRPELVAALVPRRAELTAALRQVEGCVQMTMRLFATAATAEEPKLGGAEVPPSGGEGTRYLKARQGPPLPSGIAELRQAVAPLLRDQRFERATRPPLLATAHDLLARESEAAYRQVVAERSAGAPWQARLSGPWPPYAFAPGLGR